MATDNTTVVSCINKEGGMRSGSLCALLWRLLSWYNLRDIVLRSRHIPGRLNVIADKLSRHQVIQTELSLLQEVLNLLCSRWAKPQLDLFATTFKNKLALQVCICGAALGSLESRCVESTLGRSGCIHFSHCVTSKPDNIQSDRPGILEDDPDCTRLAQHTLVLGSGQSLHPDTLFSPTEGKSADSTIQRVPTHGPLELESPCLAP